MKSRAAGPDSEAGAATSSEAGMPTPAQAATPILIVGAGFGGLCMAIRLKQSGIHDFIVLEQADEVGGTWRDNRYPGAACDVPSHLYSFSFELNPAWERTFGTQREIQQYLVRCADKFRVRSHIRFGVTVERARYDEAAGVWALETRSGERLWARAVVLACGGLSRPRVPDLPGLASFEGQAFHSARWDDRVPLEGKSVSVIGTGASAIQIVPSIADKVARLHLYQRTPAWILAKPDRPIRGLERALFRYVPGLQRLLRIAIYWRLEALVFGFVLWPRILQLAERMGRRYLAAQVPDPTLRARLLPRYAIGCKRILPTNDFYPALARENVELVTDPIEAIGPRSIRTKDGRERPADVIVLATGFRAAEPAAPFELVGRGGRRLDEEWRNGAEAYLGTTVSGFPNLFFIVGPNTGLGHSSMIAMIESQAQYIWSCLRTMRARGLKSVDVRADAQRRYNEKLSTRLRKTVWASGCTSWYQTESGKITTLWPGFTFEFRLRTRRFDGHNYTLVPK